MERICNQNKSPYETPESSVIFDATSNYNAQESGIDLNESESSAISILSSTPISSASSQLNNNSANSDSFISILSSTPISSASSQLNNSTNSDSFVSIESHSSASFLSCKSAPTSPDSSLGGNSLNSDKSPASNYNWLVYQPSAFDTRVSNHRRRLDLNCLNVLNSYVCESTDTRASTPDTVRNIVADLFDFEENESPGNPSTASPPEDGFGASIASNYKPGNVIKNPEKGMGTHNSDVGIGTKHEGLDYDRLKELEMCNFRDCVDTQICNSDHIHGNECHPSVKVINEYIW